MLERFKNIFRKEKESNDDEVRAITKKLADSEVKVKELEEKLKKADRSRTIVTKQYAESNGVLASELSGAADSIVKFSEMYLKEREEVIKLEAAIVSMNLRLKGKDSAIKELKEKMEKSSPD